MSQVALVAQWIEHLTTDQKVVGSTPAESAIDCVPQSLFETVSPEEM